MKISIIIPVYNGGDSIARCLEALLGQDYPADDYEIIVINDGSTDNTKDVVERYPVKLINLEENSGRLIARERGAQAARYDILLLIDSRVIASQDLLKQIARINYQPLLAGELGEDKYRSPFDTLFYLIRRTVYAPYYPQKDWGEELWIDEGNFDKVPKGTTCLVCSRQLFLQSLPDKKDKSVNDDIHLIRAIIKDRKLLRHTALRVIYLQRTGWKVVLSHIYERGPRFADYYLRGSSRYYNLWRGGLLLLSVVFTIGLVFPPVWCYFFGGVLICLAGVAVFLSENIKDFVIVLTHLPLVALAFLAGIIKGKML